MTVIKSTIRAVGPLTQIAIAVRWTVRLITLFRRWRIPSKQWVLLHGAHTTRQNISTCKVCAVWYRRAIDGKLVVVQGSPFAGKKATMENYHADELRAELSQLLRKQTEVLESRSFGAATDADILEYEIRQEIIHDICNELANAAAA
jgi:hypothetical protein